MERNKLQFTGCSIGFDLSPLYTWEGGFGATIVSVEDGFVPFGTCRYIRNKLFYAYIVQPVRQNILQRIFCKPQYRISWSLANEKCSAEEIREFKNSVVKSVFG